MNKYFVSSLKSAGLDISVQELDSVWKYVESDEKCNVKGPDQCKSVVAVLKQHLLKSTGASMFSIDLNTSRYLNQHLEEILTMHAERYVEDLYMGIDLNRIVTLFKQELMYVEQDELKVIIDLFMYDKKVCAAYELYTLELAPDSKHDGRDESCISTEHAFRSAMFDLAKISLYPVIPPVDIYKFKNDTDYIIYEMVQSYEEESMVDADGLFESVRTLARLARFEDTQFFVELAEFKLAYTECVESNDRYSIKWCDNIKAHYVKMIYNGVK